MYMPARTRSNRWLAVIGLVAGIAGIVALVTGWSGLGATLIAVSAVILFTVAVLVTGLVPTTPHSTRPTTAQAPPRARTR